MLIHWSIRLKTICLLFSLILCESSIGCAGRQRRPSRYVFPEGYVGWVRIDYNVSGTPTLPVEEEHYLFVVPSSGRLQTSSDMEYGWSSNDDYYYFNGCSRTLLNHFSDDSRGMIWGQSNGWEGFSYEERIATFQHIFVGTQEEYRRFGQEKDENYQPRIGNVRATAMLHMLLLETSQLCLL